ncbi:hypothetical protein N836_20290 [Leptolyngbya sp. Heron Island J]|uniref:hypothetical protein n=1 Tax=Leptolyngbya sp. Heron Island J TaxID=1385935 RepID=UPI0003B9A8C1|nr:hypothetical protein [Leptolyngbya sp. Heron Island J]ESA33766.1 hypothetical protein N836_20290 [Leptolyngbya sp. Heron Island J]
MSKIKQTLITKQAFIFFIYVILILDVAYRVWNRSDTILDWQLVTILGLLTFAILGDRISEFIIGREGITLKQNIDIQVLEVKKDTEDLQLINETGNARYIDGLLKRAMSSDRDVWSKLIIYRLSLRALARQICKDQGMYLGDCPSLTSMINFMKEKDLITAQFKRDLNFMKSSTFFFEWGTGTPPTVEEIRRVLDIAPQVLKYLEYMIEDQRQAT